MSTPGCTCSTSATMSPMPSTRPAWRSASNTSSPSIFSRHAGELDRRAGDLPHRQRGAAARVAVELGQHDAGQRQRLLEGLGGVDRVLALHGIDDEQRLDRVERGVQLADLAHQRLVDGQPAGGVDQQHVEVVAARVVERGQRDVERLLVGRAGEPLGAGLLRSPSSAARWRPAGRRRPRPSAPSSCASRSGAWPAWPWWWSCRRPAGRPSGSPPAAGRPG